MNRIFLNLLFLVMIFSLCIFGCKSGKQAAAFKDSKLPIDTLSLFFPNVVVDAATANERYSDEELALIISKEISALNTTTLKGKYKLVSETFFLDPTLASDATSFFNSLDSLNGRVENLTLPYWLNNNEEDKDRNRYFLATFFYGYYHPDYEPNYAMKQSLRTNTILLGSSGLNWVSIKVLLADRKTNKILFYNADDSYQSDPRILSSVEAMIKKLIKPVYYR